MHAIGSVPMSVLAVPQRSLKLQSARFGHTEKPNESEKDALPIQIKFPSGLKHYHGVDWLQASILAGVYAVHAFLTGPSTDEQVQAKAQTLCESEAHFERPTCQILANAQNLSFVDKLQLKQMLEMMPKEPGTVRIEGTTVHEPLNVVDRQILEGASSRAEEGSFTKIIRNLF